MALRRMFSLEVVDTDLFLNLPPSAQCLYFHLGMRADDDGFVSSARKITAMVGCRPRDLQLLVQAGLVLQFPTGVFVVRHWKVNNSIKKDRYHPTQYIQEKAQLTLDGSNLYHLPEPEWIQSGTTLEPQVRLGKVRSGQDRVGEAEDAADAAAHPSRPKRTARSRYGWVRLSDEELEGLRRDLGEAELERCLTYVDESAQTSGNKNKWHDWNLVLRRCHRERWGMGRPGEARSVRAAKDYDDEDSFV